MWTGHFEVWHENCIYLTNCKKFNVEISMYPMNSYVAGRFRHLTNLCIFNGLQRNIDRFVEALRRDRRCVSVIGSYSTYLTYMKLDKTDYHTTNYFIHNKLFLLRPIVHKEGVEDWYVASWEKEFVLELYDIFRKHFHVRLRSIKKEEFPDLYIPTVMPKLTRKQKDALTRAISAGYYSLPRKTTLEKLAAQGGVSRITFQEHLRKAEEKLIPPLFGYVSTPERGKE